MCKSCFIVSPPFPKLCASYKIKWCYLVYNVKVFNNIKHTVGGEWK